MKRTFYLFGLLFLIICIFTIPMIDNNTLKVNVSLDDSIGFTNQKLMLLDKNNYFVEVDVFLNPIDNIYQVKSIFDYLKVSNSDRSSSFNGYIRDDINLLDYNVVDSVLYLNLSDKIDDIYLPGLIHSYLINTSYSKIAISVNSELYGVYDSNYPINKQEEFISRKNIDKVVVYYVDKIDGDNYYLPITKYINTDKEKIEVIIDELKEKIPTSLVSYLNIHTELIDYNFENNMLILDFNEYLLDDKKEENMRVISDSVFSNYDVSSVLFRVNGQIEKIKYSSKKP